MIENTGTPYPIYKSTVTKSNYKEIVFNGDDISGTLKKSGKKVTGGLTLGNYFPYQYTFTVSIIGNIVSKNRIEGSYSSDVRLGTFTITE